MAQKRKAARRKSHSKARPGRARRIPDASASVAGYEYQFLWAALRCLHLLAPNAKSRQVVVESLHGPDVDTLLAEDEDLLVVDVAEYEGGNTIDEAERVVVSQLKYSPTAPNKSWTVDGLCTSRSANPKRSIIGGLGLIFQRFWKASNNRSELPQRLLLSLVTNRPFQEKAHSTIAKARRLITERESSALPTTAWLLRQPNLSNEDKKRLIKLKETTSLTSTEFPIFLACLDMTGFGQPSLEWLEKLAQKTLVEMGGIRREDVLSQLRDRVRKDAMDGKSKAIRPEDVLAYFFCSEREFLPAPNRIKLPTTAIDTNDIRELSASVRDAKGQVLAHGAAGKGKSVTVSHIANHLPLGAEAVVYDCFGNGEWDGASHGYRHSSIRFCSQIVNELAVRFGTGLFYSPKHTSKQDRWTLVKDALERVVQRIPGDGLLVLVVDAADNARDSFDACSDFDREDLFLHELWSLPLPDRVRVVVTCRTGRRNDVFAPSGIQEFELEGFQPHESELHLSGAIGAVSPEAKAHFHEATEGTPRLQDYWICNELTARSAEERESEILGRKTYGIAAEYDSWVQSASNTLPDSVDAQDCVAILRCLRQPFSVTDFAACSGLSSDKARDFCLGLRSGLIVTQSGNIEFRDQDFESVLDDSLSNQQVRNAHARAGSWCLEHAGSNLYATKNAAYHLDKAGCHDDLIKRATDLGFADSLSNPDERISTATECIHLALRSCRNVGNYSAPLQLAFSLAKVARGREAGQWLFLEYPEICIHNGLHMSVRKALLETGDANGSMHFRIASALAVKGDVQTANTHLAEGEAWLRKQVATQGDHGMAAEVFNVTNSAEHGVAVALIEDVAEGVRAAACWNHKATCLDAVYEFAGQLTLISPKFIGSSPPLPKSAPAYHAALFAGAFHSQFVPNGKSVRDCLDAVLQKSELFRSGFHELPAWLVDFAEVCLRCRADHKKVLSLFENLRVEAGGLQTYVESRAYWEQEYHNYLRALALVKTLRNEELSSDSLFPSRKESGYDQNRERAMSVANKVLPAYLLRANALRSNWNTQRAWCEAKKSLNAWSLSSRRHDLRYQSFFRTYALHIVDTMVILTGSCSDFVDELVATGKDVLYPTDFAALCMDMAEKCAVRTEYLGAAHDLAMQSAKVTEEFPMKAKERGALLLRAGRLLEGMDNKIATSLVDQALSVAQEVDEDAPHYANALSTLALVAGERCETGAKAQAQPFWKAIGALDHCAEGQDGIDWNMAVKGVTALDTNLGCSAMRALDRNGTLPLPEGMTHFLQAATSCGHDRLPPQFAGIFSPLCEDNSNTVTILAELLGRLSSKEFPAKLFTSLVRVAVLNTEYDKRAGTCRELLELATSKGLKNEVTTMLEAQVEFYSKGTNWLRHVYSSRSDSSPEQSKTIRTLRSKLKKGTYAWQPAKAVNAIFNCGAHGALLTRMLVEHGQRQRGADVIRYLDALRGLKSDVYYSPQAALSAALCELLRVLPQRQLVEKWIVGNFAGYAIHAYPSLVYYDSEFESAAKPMLESPSVPAEIRSDAIIGILCEFGHRLSPPRLFELAGSFVRNSSACLPTSVLVSELETVKGKAEDLEDSKLPSHPVELCSRIIHDAFGHADTRIRWRAFHCFRLAVALSPKAFIAAMVGHLHQKDGRLWMSATDWQLFALLCISQDSPDLVAPHANALWDIATDAKFPHAGHQELARRALENVTAADPSALSPERSAMLHVLNRPQSSLIGSEGVSVGRRGKTRFDFDSMDTMPYWYSYLGHAFGLHRCDVAIRAEKWVCDEWGLTETKCLEKEQRTSDPYSYELTSHRQGGRPTIERFIRYVEWHAMMMAAGEMVRELPQKVEHYSDGDESQWDDWIQGNAFAADTAILSDLRGPVPLDPLLLGARFGEDAVSRPLTVDDFRSAFSITREELCVAGNYSAKTHVSWWWRIDTALVAKGTARSLGMAILGSQSPSAVHLPIFEFGRACKLGQSAIDVLLSGEYGVHRDTIVDSGLFQLRPWVIRCFSEEEVGSVDPMWRSGGRVWYALGHEVVDALGLQSNKLHNVYADRSGRHTARCEIWNDERRIMRHMDSEYAEGRRLIVLKSEVVRFLKLVKMDLIVRVRINRDVEKRYGNEEAKYEEEAGVFILRSSGKLETVGIRAKARGEADR